VHFTADVEKGTKRRRERITAMVFSRQEESVLKLSTPPLIGIEIPHNSACQMISVVGRGTPTTPDLSQGSSIMTVHLRSDL